MTPLEKEIESKLVRLVRNRGGLCLKWVCPGWAGVPDRIILLPGGRVVFVELKRPRGGVLSSRQVWWGRKLRALGFRLYVIWSNENLEAFKDLEL
jgi:hypothetical protein